MSSSLATSSLLRAVGVGSGAVPATAVAAAIKWITKDGVGALGRLFVGGRLGLFIDEDPRLWRMAAEAVSTVGLSLEIATVFFPSQFLILAGTGNFAKALAKGMANPAFRVMQQHFARNNNIGEVSAKEESWEVAGQMTGLLTSIAILTSLQESASWEPILGSWVAFHSVHVFCRYFALRSLQFDSLNLVRAGRLVTDHVRHQFVSDPETISKQENFLTDWMMDVPQIQFGSSLKDLLLDAHLGNQFQSWLDIFTGESYLLFMHEGRGHVVLKHNATSDTALKALYQYIWLTNKGIHQPSLDDLQQSLIETNASFPDFVSEAMQSGWNLQTLVFRVHTTRVHQL